MQGITPTPSGGPPNEEEKHESQMIIDSGDHSQESAMKKFFDTWKNDESNAAILRKTEPDLRKILKNGYQRYAEFLYIGKQTFQSLLDG